MALVRGWGMKYVETKDVSFGKIMFMYSGIPRNFFRGGVQQIQLRTEDRDNRDLGAVAP